jgi:hypothetical protein
LNTRGIYLSQAQVLGIRASESYFGRSAADEEGCKKERPLNRIWQSSSENISAFIKRIINGSQVLHNSGFNKSKTNTLRDDGCQISQIVFQEFVGYQ